MTDTMVWRARMTRWACAVPLILLTSCGVLERVGADLGIGPGIAIEVASSTMSPGQRTTVTAISRIEGGIVWASTFGTIEGSGDTVTFRAPVNVAGPISITARSATDPKRSAAARIIVTDDFAQDVMIYSTGRVVRLKVSDIPAIPSFDLTTRTLYETFDDVFDFFLFVRAGPGFHCGYGPVVRQSIEGIGRATFDETAQFGSAGRLMGIAYSNSFTFPQLGITIPKAFTASILDIGPFWGFSSAAGYLGGFDRSTLVDLGNGRYRATSAPGTSTFWTGVTSRPFSPIELYLMGLLASDEVPPLLVANDAAWIDQADGVFAASGFTEYSITDVIDRHGPRLPAVGEAQTAFRAATVILADRPVTAEQWASLDAQVAFFGRPERATQINAWGKEEHTFTGMTSGLATLTMDGLFDAVRVDR